jgi:hypothetical protein
MWTAIGDARRAAVSAPLWAGVLRLALALSIGIALLVVAFTAFVVVLPLLLAGGLALHFYLRRRLRQAARQAQRPSRRGPGETTVIEGEYTVIERR